MKHEALFSHQSGLSPTVQPTLLGQVTLTDLDFSGPFHGAAVDSADLYRSGCCVCVFPSGMSVELCFLLISFGGGGSLFPTSNDWSRGSFFFFLTASDLSCGYRAGIGKNVSVLLQGVARYTFIQKHPETK